MITYLILLCIALSSICQAKSLHFDPQDAHVSYTIVDKTTGTIKIPEGKVALKSHCTSQIVLQLTSPNTLEIAFPKIECRLTLGKGAYRQEHVLQANGDNPSQHFEDTFEGLLNDLCRQKFVFQIDPTGKIIETTGNLALLEEARRDGRHSIANVLTLNPINQFFNQLHHLAGKKLSAKTYRLPVTSFFPGYRHPKKRAFSYTVQKPKGKMIVAKVMGNHTHSKKNASETVAVKGTVRWDAKNAYLQERHLKIDHTSKIKKSSVILHTKEEWQSKYISIPTTGTLNEN